MKRKIEIFSAHCVVCEEVIAKIRSLAYSSCEVAVLDMHDEKVTKRGKELGIQRVPAVSVDGTLLECCTVRGVDENVLRVAGVGKPLNLVSF